MRTLTFDFDNLHGIANMYAIPIASVYQCVQNPLTGQATLTLNDSVMVVQIPVYRGDRFKIDEVQKLVDGGDCWEVTIAGIIPKRCSLNDGVIQDLERGEWIVLSQDANGVIVLYGSTEVPLKLPIREVPAQVVISMAPNLLFPQLNPHLLWYLQSYLL